MMREPETHGEEIDEHAMPTAPYSVDSQSGQFPIGASLIWATPYQADMGPGGFRSFVVTY